jgi:hypothetical protein
MTNLIMIQQEILSNGGVTVNNSVRQIIGSSHQITVNEVQGYVVGNNQCSVIIENYGNNGLPELEQALQSLDNNTNGDNDTVGFWLDKNTGTLYIDAVVICPTLAEAMNLGAANGELAIWDADLGREIRL